MNLVAHSALPVRWLTAVLVCALAAPASRADDDVRFSATLSPAQRAETGLDRLTTDNVAVIDALVRLDIAATRFRDNNIRSTRFSQRRTAHERDIAGLDHLSQDQLAKLDAIVALRIPAPALPPDASLAYAGVSLDTSTVPSPDRRPAPEIHGSFSLTYGWSKAGSVRGADSVITYVDPTRGFSLTVGYSQYRGTGLAPYPYLGADNLYTPAYRPIPAITPDDR
jgi:hypothetical protein